MDSQLQTVLIDICESVAQELEEVIERELVLAVRSLREKS